MQVKRRGKNLIVSHPHHQISKVHKGNCFLPLLAHICISNNAPCGLVTCSVRVCAWTTTDLIFATFTLFRYMKRERERINPERGGGGGGLHFCVLVHSVTRLLKLFMSCSVRASMPTTHRTHTQHKFMPNEVSWKLNDCVHVKRATHTHTHTSEVGHSVEFHPVPSKPLILPAFLLHFLKANPKTLSLSG